MYKPITRKQINNQEEFTMTVTKTKKGTELVIAIEGRVDTTTSPQLETEIKDFASCVMPLSKALL